jgi:histidinol-phosphate/aromatic aminotransferase/cobyric acid decarboxylase-like protein
VLVLNTPHNPTGKVFTDDEMRFVASLAVAHDLLVVTDEIYEHFVCDGHRHIALATLPDMRERTIIHREFDLKDRSSRRSDSPPGFPPFTTMWMQAIR